MLEFCYFSFYSLRAEEVDVKVQEYREILMSQHEEEEP